MEFLYEKLYEWFSLLGLSASSISLGQRLTVIVLIAFLAWLTDYLCRCIATPIVLKITKKTPFKWDDHLFNSRILNDLCHIVPAIVVYILLPFAFNDRPLLQAFLTKASIIYIIITFLRLACQFTSLLYEISNTYEKSNSRPLKGIFQMIKVLTISLGIILIFSVIFDKSPIDLFVGLGAAATVLMLVFKDTIVGLVSGVQLSANDMLHLGDWITLSKHNVDGIVIEVGLTTVKVRNWDNTISTIPPYTLVSESFQNWRNMFESEGRRVKRHILIDMTSVRFCNDEEIKRYKDEGLIHSEEKTSEITNITILRRHLISYLRNNQRVNSQMTLMVRQLQPDGKGMPLELYFFSADRNWVAYETLQADVFDYVMAIVPKFGLRLFQVPMGSDLHILHNGDSSNNLP